MENAKAGYSEITKLSIPNPTFNPVTSENANNTKTFKNNKWGHNQAKNAKYLPRNLQAAAQPKKLKV